MPSDVPMPKLGLTMEEATIIEWLVADGAPVEADTPIVLIETDKTETEVGSPGAGRLHQIARPGDVLPCGQTIAMLLADGEAPPAGAAGPVAPAATATQRVVPPPTPAATAPVVHVGGRLFASPNARRVAAERGIPLASLRGTGPGGRIVSEDVEAAPLVAARLAVAPSRSAAPVVASVAARSLADLLGIDLAQVAPDPVEGRVTRDGVALHVRLLLQQLTSAPQPAPFGMPLLQEPTSTIRLSGMRGTIAKRMRASLQEMAQLTLTMDADMTEVLADRARRGGDETRPTITDYVVAATARALLRHPLMNAQVVDAGIALLPEVHVGLAVAVDGGLLVPVVRNTAQRDLIDLARETARVATLARDGAISPADLEGGTFSVSALGAYGVDTFTPVINPPNAGVLGIGRLRDDVVVDDGSITTLKRLTLSLTWDHRVLDGVPAAEFCRTIVDLLADPAALDKPA
ncbi:MAG TPA: dihydrolipoamide acetyltransferase family protein [Acidimicrobiales bacterium]|nr:dihydrolipoamide acetyltransferase family protein [Acidimicrobiales bacterium]